MTRARHLATLVLLRLRRLALLERGQAMTEYASITTMLLLGGLAAGTGWPYFRLMIGGLDKYLTSVYFTLNLALP